MGSGGRSGRRRDGERGTWLARGPALWLVAFAIVIPEPGSPDGAEPGARVLAGVTASHALSAGGPASPFPGKPGGREISVDCGPAVALPRLASRPPQGEGRRLSPSVSDGSRAGHRSRVERPPEPLG